MIDSAKQSDLDITLSTITDDLNPFFAIAKAIKSRLSLTYSTFSLVLFATFFVFHAMIFVFCWFLLIMSWISGRERARWLVRNLYIRDQSGQKVYKSPLYFFNAGILMAFFQILCSVSSGTYIWFQMRSTHSIADYTVDVRIVPPLASMFVFDTLSHWTLTYCFFVTVYFSRPFNLGMKKGMIKWISPPVLINTFFIGFPICVTVVVAGVSLWATSKYDRFAVQVMKSLDALMQGSSAWQQLHEGIILSAQERSQISNHLVDIAYTIKRIFTHIGPRIEASSHAFHWCLVVIFLIVCINFLVFVPVFYLLVQKYQRSVRRRSSWMLIMPRVGHHHCSNWTKHESSDNPSETVPVLANRNSTRTSITNKQFSLLLLRTLGVFLSLISQMITTLILIIKSHDVLLQKYWRNVGSWLAVVGGAWSAIPIVWQCWRLYADRTNNEFSRFSKNNPSPVPPKNEYHHSFQPCQTRDVELEIKLPDSTPSSSESHCHDVELEIKLPETINQYHHGFQPCQTQDVVELEICSDSHDVDLEIKLPDSSLSDSHCQDVELEIKLPESVHSISDSSTISV